MPVNFLRIRLTPVGKTGYSWTKFARR
jgi:hypothetical protein